MPKFAQLLKSISICLNIVEERREEVRGIPPFNMPFHFSAPLYSKTQELSLLNAQCAHRSPALLQLGSHPHHSTVLLLSSLLETPFLPNSVLIVQHGALSLGSQHSASPGHPPSLPSLLPYLLQTSKAPALSFCPLCTVSPWLVSPDVWL